MKKILILIGFMAVCISQQGCAQLLKTNLSVMVVDELGNVQEDATVSLYNNEQDYRDDKNAVVTERLTDEKGKLKIKGLASKEYFIRVTKGSKDNTGGGVKTGKLIEKRTNRINIVISDL